MGESCCGPAHGHEQTTETLQADACGGGSCGSGAEGDACGGGSCGSGGGCGSGSMTQEQLVERASLQGFLTGLYVATLPREKMASYFESLSSQTGSEFARPAQFLSSVLTALPNDPAAPNAHKPVSTQLLEFISGETVE